MAKDGITRRGALEGVVGLVVSCVVADSALGSTLVVDGSGAAKQDIVVADDVPGLLASIRTLPEGATVRTANGYAYEVLPLSADPFDEHTAPEGFQLQTAGGSKLRIRLSDSVTPEMLNGDLHMAAACAAVFKVTLMTGRIDYEITTAFQPHDITWISDKTRIKQMNTSGVSCLLPGSNLRVVGRVFLYLAPVGSGSANRAHVLCGNWATGEGIKNFYFDEFVLEGGHVNCNGFSVAGNSHNIRGRRIDAGVSTQIGRAFLAHWGNFDNHWASGGTYQHAIDPAPTTHPHDIVIDEVAGDLELSTGDFCALWCVSAGYDIHVDRINGRCVNNGAGPGHLALLTAGDLGLAYASPGELAAGMWGLGIGSVTGYSSESTVRRIGRALYYNMDSTPQAAESYFVKIQDAVGNVDGDGPSNNSYCAVDGHNGRGVSRYGKVRSRNFRSACGFANFNKDVSVDTVEAIDSQNQAMQLAGSGDIEADWPTGINIGILRVSGTGIGESTAGQSTVSNINKIIDLNIGTIIIDKLKDMPDFAAPSIHIQADARGVKIGNILQNWTGTGQTSVVFNSATAEESVEIGHVQAPTIVRPIISAGAIVGRVTRN